MDSKPTIESPRHPVILGRVLWMVAALVVAAPTVEAQVGEYFAFNEHAPGSRFFADGQLAYRAGQYGLAMDNFRQAARWADKFAQFNIGVMYLRGEGVEPDQERGWAWLELASERGYAQFMQSADQVWMGLQPQERQRARRFLEEELLPVYGDERTVDRTAREMEIRRRRATGSRLGSIGHLTILDGSGGMRTGHEFYDARKWDFRRLVQIESVLMDALASGRTELRDLDLEELLEPAVPANTEVPEQD